MRLAGVPLKTGTALALIAALGFGPAWAGPQGGVVTNGSATITQSGHNTTITQSTQRGIINWNSFDVQGHESVHFAQPNQHAITVNRINDTKASRIDGSITANGNIMLLNQHGVLFGSGSRVDVGGLIASTSDISNPNEFMNGANAALNITGNPNAQIINQGTITIGNAGLAGFVAPYVKNEGIIQAQLGRVNIAGANMATVDFAGDGLIHVAISDDNLARRITNTGVISADGGRVVMTAATARGVVDSLIDNQGTIRTASVDNTKLGSITLSGVGSTIKNTGTINAEGNATIKGGTIAVKGNFAALGGTISANGSSGGDITIETAGTLSLADTITAKGLAAQGGTITVKSGADTWETSTSKIDASGKTDGGTINTQTAHNLVSSGQYKVVGETGKGGHIDMTAGSVKLLSAKLDASGHTDGGQIRIGGEYQGGKHLAEGVDELANAQITTIDRNTQILAESTGNHGKGGTVIVWSDEDTMVLGTIKARPGYQSGDGGFVELSSADVLNYGATIETGRDTRQGSVLLDPKNIIIAESSFNPTAILMGRGYVAPNLKIDSFTGSGDFGTSVDLDGRNMVIGYYRSDSIDGNLSETGAVFLYTFADDTFGGAVLQGIMGHGYTGGKNVDTSSYVDEKDWFGRSVSLDGNRLAVGASYDSGHNNSRSRSGTVYLYTFGDLEFSDSTLVSRMGSGYTGLNDYNLSAELGSSDYFGHNVSLDGTRLAVAATGDDGFNNTRTNSGVIYLFDFADLEFSDPTLHGRIGYGYTGANDVNLSNLDIDDNFGSGMALDGRYLAAGSYAMAGNGNTRERSGEVLFFRFSDDSWGGAELLSHLGLGYTGTHDVNLDLRNRDDFGASIALDQGRLAIGARYDDGATDNVTDSGVVYLYSFDESNFLGFTLEARIGNNYGTLGGKNTSVPIQAASQNYFGAGLALDGNRLIIGATADPGPTYNASQGAFHFFTFDNHLFEDLTYQGSLGYGYSGGKNVNFLHNTSRSSVDGRHAFSLSGLNLAVGFALDDGFSGGKGDAGAVHLYRFGSNAYDSLILQGVIGDGYVGGKNVDMSEYLDVGDRFGYSLSLEGTQLAVGASHDDGLDNFRINSGAVYLFSFDDTELNGGQLKARLGSGYGTLGGINYSVTNLTSNNDYFGSSVSLNSNGLAVGAYGDGGLSNNRAGAGAVYLFSFADDQFSSPVQRSIIGYGYTGSNNYNLSTLDGNDGFGRYGVSLDGNRLAVTAQGDDGADNARSNTGAAYLFTFDDGQFTTPTLRARIGYGYTGGNDINLDLEVDDMLSGIALSGNTLVIGAVGDDGLGNVNSTGNVGALYVYAFDDLMFNGGRLDFIMGQGYTGGKNVNTHSYAGGNYYFGRYLEISDGNLLASMQNSGYQSNYTSSGGIVMYRGNTGGSVSDAQFSYAVGTQIGLTPSAIAALLATPQDVTIQASNDILVENDIIVNNLSGDGGTLTLQAGRSILLNANIVTDNGNLNLLANEKLATGVINADRDAGKAIIQMAAGTYINAGTGEVYIRLDDGAGKTNAQTGDIYLRDITAGNIVVDSAALTRSSIVLNGTLTSTGAGTAITLAAGKDLINNAGATALQTPNGRWLAYTDSPKLDKLDGLAPDFFQHRCVYGGSCTPQSGNGIFYEYGEHLLSITVNTSRYYGMDNPTAADLLSLLEFIGFENGDGIDALGSLPTITIVSTANASANAGTTHEIILSGGSDDYYEHYFFGESLLTIDKKPVTATWNGPLSKTYGSTNPVPVVSGLFTFDGFVNGQNSSVLQTASIDWNGIVNGTNAGTYSIFANLDSQNYTYLVDPGQMIITPKSLTATWRDDQTRSYGDANPTINYADFTFAGGFVGTDNASVFSITPDWNGVGVTTGVGTYEIGATFNANNYVITNTPTANLLITKRNITATVGDTSRTYGDANPTLTGSNVTWSNLVNGDTFANFNDFGFTYGGADATSGAGSVYDITLVDFDADNYNLTSVTDGALSITKRDITATVSDSSRAYGDVNPTITGSNVTWSNLVNGDTFANFNDFDFTFGGANANSNAGTTHVIGLTGFDADNYALTTVTEGELTINKRDITASVNDLQREYGTGGQAFTWQNVTWSNLVNGDTGAGFNTVGIGSTATNLSNAGTQHVVSINSFNDANYNLVSSTDGQLDITRAELTIQVNNASRNEGVSNPNFSYVVTGLKNGETANVLSGVQLTTLANTLSGAGVYAITVTGGVADNYVVTAYLDGQLTVLELPKDNTPVLPPTISAPMVNQPVRTDNEFPENLIRNRIANLITNERDRERIFTIVPDVVHATPMTSRVYNMPLIGVTEGLMNIINRPTVSLIQNTDNNG